MPLNQLRFGPQEEQVWGMHAWRWIDRNQEEVQWQLIPRQNTGRMYQLGELHGIRGLPRPRHVELLPFALGRASTGPSVPEGGTDGSGAVGLDAKVGLSSNFTLDATVNPDFGQVEADPSVVNLTAYETFYEEKRPFFLEGRKILAFEVEDEDQLFYSRRIGAPPSGAPFLGPDEEMTSLPDSTTILGAFKVTGRTDGGLSVAVLQAFTQKETASVTSPLGPRDAVVEPFGSFTAGRLHKDWDKGNTSLGGMLTSTHRWVGDSAARAFLPTPGDHAAGSTSPVTSPTARGCSRRTASRAASTGDPAAILALQTNAVHYYQRPDASHLGVDPNATSLSGHGGSVRFGRSDTSRLRLTDHFHWYSPGLDLNDVGYLRQADLIANQVFLGWSEPTPRGIFRSYSVQLAREDQWDFGGLQTTLAHTELEASGQFKNKWARRGERLDYQDVVDTRACCAAGPRCAGTTTTRRSSGGGTDDSRAGLRVARDGSYVLGARRRLAGLEPRAGLNLRPSNRLSLSGSVSLREAARQPAVRGDRRRGRRPALGARPHRPGHLELHLPGEPLDHAGPDAPVLREPVHRDRPLLGLQARRRTRWRTDNADRFHLFGPDEIAFRPDGERLPRDRGGAGPSYSFANPDFSFRQFRSNLVARWEWKPGSSLYVVWSQGRTAYAPEWDGSFGSNWDSLREAPPDNVFLVKLSYWFSP